MASKRISNLNDVALQALHVDRRLHLALLIVHGADRLVFNAYIDLFTKVILIQLYYAILVADVSHALSALVIVVDQPTTPSTAARKYFSAAVKSTSLSSFIF
jgi:hypothetical protein